MLTVIQIRNTSQKKEILKKFDSTKSTWIVSDLRTKFELQNYLLNKAGFFISEDVLRANEFWQKLLNRSFPHLKIVSKDFVRIQLNEWMTADSLNLPQQSDMTLLQMADLLAPLVFHPEGHDKLLEWFAANPNSEKRWKSWYLIAENYLHLFFKKGIIASTWCSAILQSQFGWEQNWEKNLVFDLGAELSNVEAELIHSLSRFLDVTVISPAPTWRNEFAHILNSYDYLIANAKEVQEPEKPGEPPVTSDLFKFTGVLAEVKHAAAQVRRWYMEGLSLDAMTIIAPEIEIYWPILKPIFDEEGIPVAKDETIRIQSLPKISLWLSDLRAHSRQGVFADLEMSYYLKNSGDQLGKMRFEKFEALFATLLDASDLSRHPEIEKSFHAEFSLNDQLKRNQFLGWVAKLYPGDFGTFDILERVLREVLTVCSEETTFSLTHWIQFIETVCSRIEVRVQAGQIDGVQVCNLMQAESFQAKNRIFLGLTEGQFREKGSVLISGKEIDQIARELGFFFSHPEQSPKQFELRWLLQDPFCKNHLAFPATTIEGAVEAPHPIWLQLAENQHSEFSLPEFTRWDSIKKQQDLSMIASERKFTQEEYTDKAHAIAIDLQLEPRDTIAFDFTMGFSPSSFESYLKCPFVFTAERIFQLKDLPELDLDLDRRSQGQLVHALLEELSRNDSKRTQTDDQTLELLESLKIKSGISFGEPEIWNSLKVRYLKLAKRFLEFEKKWFEQYPKSKVVARELEINLFFDRKSRQLTNTVTENSIRVRGKVDRVEASTEATDVTKVVVVDYKSSDSPEYSFSQWLKQNQLQLGFYSLALDLNLVPEFKDAKVIGAVYYVYKNFTRNKGFLLSEEAGDLFPILPRNKFTESTKNEFYQDLMKRISDFVELVDQGVFPAIPADFDQCPSCKWRGLCRAPHLH